MSESGPEAAEVVAQGRSLSRFGIMHISRAPGGGGSLPSAKTGKLRLTMDTCAHGLSRGGQVCPILRR